MINYPEFVDLGELAPRPSSSESSPSLPGPALFEAPLPLLLCHPLDRLQHLFKHFLGHVLDAVLVVAPAGQQDLWVAQTPSHLHQEVKCALLQ